MQVGVVFPQTEIGSDVAEIREYVQAAEDLGYTHIFIADHVLGADPRTHQHVVNSPYTHKSLVHEPLTLMSYMAAITKTVVLATGILILPQRQTALVAKQAAEVDVLSGGRLRLGIGVGWNHVEYEALGEDFHTRGRRCEEQIAVLRALWSQEVVNFQGRWHRITDAGLNPLPVQRPIPIWIGGGSSARPAPGDAVLRRIARLADGWSPSFGPDAEGRDIVARLHGYAQEVRRDPAGISLEGRLRIAGKRPGEWVKEIMAWEALGASHLIVETRRGGLVTAKQHIDAIRRFKEALDDR